MAQGSSWSSETDSSSRETSANTAILSRFGRANSAVLSRYGKRSSLFAPYPMESPITNLPSSSPSRTSSSISQTPVGFESASEQLFLCRRAYGDLLRCIPYTSANVI
ncbi:hypothetical protein Ddc_00498 [Ditylenchus destructor]|nr:hypothetical protein Ddc_00498 [Ditylenchus destructor]